MTTLTPAQVQEEKDFYAFLKRFDLSKVTIGEIGRHGIASMSILAEFDPDNFDMFFTRIGTKIRTSKLLPSLNLLRNGKTSSNQ